jgi:hypothetical protein
VGGRSAAHGEGGPPVEHAEDRAENQTGHAGRLTGTMVPNPGAAAPPATPEERKSVTHGDSGS